jgi:hypothetical protein
MRNGNILEGFRFREADSRYMPDSADDKERAVEVYNEWRWDMSKTFFANVSIAESVTFNMKQAGCEDLPNGRKFYNRTKREVFKVMTVIPEFRSSFDFVETAGKGADGEGNIGTKSMAELFTTFTAPILGLFNERKIEASRDVWVATPWLLIITPQK